MKSLYKRSFLWCPLTLLWSSLFRIARPQVLFWTSLLSIHSISIRKNSVCILVNFSEMILREHRIEHPTIPSHNWWSPTHVVRPVSISHELRTFQRQKRMISPKSSIIYIQGQSSSQLNSQSSTLTPGVIMHWVHFNRWLNADSHYTHFWYYLHIWCAHRSTQAFRSRWPANISLLECYSMGVWFPLQINRGAIHFLRLLSFRSNYITHTYSSSRECLDLCRNAEHLFSA